jgi:phage baseplate assembly protein V
MIERIRTWLGIGRATLADDTGELQTLQVTEGAVGNGIGDRITDAVRRVAEYGFFSVPPIGSEVVMLYRGGDRSKPLVVATSHRPSRPRGRKPGDAGIYNGVTGAIVSLTGDGLDIDAAGLPITVRNYAKATFEGDVYATGDVFGRDGAVSLNTLHDAYAAHRHDGVAAGGAVTGATDHPVP